MSNFQTILRKVNKGTHGLLFGLVEFGSHFDLYSCIGFYNISNHSFRQRINQRVWKQPAKH